MLDRLPHWAEPVADYILHTGVKNTLIIAGISVLLSLVVGVLLGTLLTIKFVPIRAAIRSYIEIWRGLPIIVTIFILFFGLPTLADELHIEALRLSEIKAAILGLSLWGSAQIAEATRGAVQSIPREQHEASAALGFGWVGRHVDVILPQALRRLLPPLVSLSVNVIQNSTLAQILGVPQILDTGKQQVERITSPPPAGLGEIHAIEIYGAVMVVFFLISFTLTRLAIFLERRLV